jgi:hypothetical protein
MMNGLSAIMQLMPVNNRRTRIYFRDSFGSQWIGSKSWFRKWAWLYGELKGQLVCGPAAEIVQPKGDRLTS